MGLYEGMYNTKLTPQQEKKYQEWVNTLPENQRSVEDYDMRGAYLAGEGQGDNGHFTDKFKKPNHPTFSSDSQYSIEDSPGGQWVPSGDKWSFKPSPVNLMHYSPDDLKSYFGRFEPDSQLILDK